MQPNTHRVVDIRGNTLLHWVAAGGNINVIKLLLSS